MLAIGPRAAALTDGRCTVTEWEGKVPARRDALDERRVDEADLTVADRVRESLDEVVGPLSKVSIADARPVAFM
ncbi:MAG: hypothetical protein JWN04_3709 [Myxococcaceae bacterium]|nr:hypothetical protein [Myxococcaceae bacterium]